MRGPGPESRSTSIRRRCCDTRLSSAARRRPRQRGCGTDFDRGAGFSPTLLRRPGLNGGMEPRAARLDQEALLANAGWLHALAASLVRDPATADDLVQDTWLVALQHPPRNEGSTQAWLARVLRNFALKRRRAELRQ